MTWADHTLIALDTETTGVDTETARIVTASIVTVDVAAGTTQDRDWLVAVDTDIPAEATAVHGISTEHARQHGRPVAEVLAEIHAAVTHAFDECVPVVIYNASYDFTVLDRELRRHHPAVGYSWQGSLPEVVDPYIIDKALDKYRKGSRRLADVCAHYGITLAEHDAHTSSGDAIAAARLAWKLANVYPEIGAASTTDLHRQQQQWAAQQADSFVAYLDRQLGKLIREHGLDQGNPASPPVWDEVRELQQRIDSVSGEWPIRRLPDGQIGVA